MTVRRLASAIGYSQPVLYGHFPGGREEIVRHVVIDGFQQLADALAGSDQVVDQRERVSQVANRYLAFARDNVAVYDAMFSMPVDVAFASATTPQPLRDAFSWILRAAASGGATSDGDAETRAELLWSALHGLAQLSQHARLRPSHEQARLDLLIEFFS